MADRRIAYNILHRIIADGAYANLAIKAGLSGCDGNECAAVTALVYCTIEHIGYADFLIEHYASGRVHGSIRLVLRMGIAEMLFMNTPPFAVCNMSAELTKRIGKANLAGFVNGVLRRIERERNALPELPKDSALRFNIEYNVPVFMAREYISEYGVEFTDSMLKKRIHHTTVRAQYPYTRQMLTNALESEDKKYRLGDIVDDAVYIERSTDLANAQMFREGRITIQSESAMLVCRACMVKDGMQVLDACAAPGGKSAYLASLMHNTGHITAWDVHPHRVELIKATVKRLNIESIRAELQDATEPNTDMFGKLDVVLADVPCSGFGGGSKPDAFLNRTEQSLDELIAVQGRILDCCCNYVKPGGALIYSTCTVSKRENDGNIDLFLSKHREFALDGFASCVPEGYAVRADKGRLQLFPHIDGVDGFFVARMIKRS